MKMTATFAVMHFAIAFTVVWLLTGDLIVGGLVALVEPAVNAGGHYLHDRVWARIEQRRQRERPDAVPGDPLPA